MLFKLFKDWFNSTSHKKEQIKYTYQNYDGDLSLLSEKMTGFLREQFDEIKIENSDNQTFELIAKRNSLLRNKRGFGTLQVAFRKLKRNLELIIIIREKPGHDVYTVTDPWCNALREEEIDFRNFLIESILSVVLSLKDSDHKYNEK